MPADFDPSFQIPRWSWWIVLYFFTGGVTGGMYFAAAWLDLFGDRVDRPAVRIGHQVTFPLILVCAVFLVVDLGQPLRFWHMVFESENFPVPLLKPYSPMSFGSVLLGVFGLVAFISFLDALLGRDRGLHATASPFGKVLSAIGAVAGLGLAGYTGVLLDVSNEPIWGNSPWVGALFLFSGVSTGIAALALLARRASISTVEKLSETDNYIMLFELICLVVFLVSVGALGARFIFSSPTAVLFAVVIVVGLLLPLGVHWRARNARGGTALQVASTSTWSWVLVLVGGFVLRWAVLAGPQGIGL